MFGKRRTDVQKIQDAHVVLAGCRAASLRTRIATLMSPEDRGQAVQRFLAHAGESYDTEEDIRRQLVDAQDLIRRYGASDAIVRGLLVNLSWSKTGEPNWLMRALGIAELFPHSVPERLIGFIIEFLAAKNERIGASDALSAAERFAALRSTPGLTSEEAETFRHILYRESYYPEVDTLLKAYALFM